jgi:uncharacterized protein (TIGR02231 family)
MKSLCLAGVAISAVLAAVPALAADIEAKSRIGAVTVYPDGAIVTRAVEVDLPQGSNTLVFRNLPLTVDPASIRVEGQATGALTLGAVESRLRAVDPNRPAGEGEVQLKVLREELGKVEARIAAHEGRRTMVQRFAESGPERGEKAGGLEVEKWLAAWDAVGQALAKVNEDIRLASLERQAVAEKIKALELAETQRRSRVLPEREFTVALEAGQAVKGSLTLSYRVTGASWRPAYDARLATAEGGKAGSFALVRRALVSQRTGEDWSDVEVSLSTVRAARGTAAPEVDPLRAAFFEPAPPIAYRGKVVGAPPAPMAAAPMADNMARTADAAEVKLPQKVAAAEAALDSNGFQASYKLPGRLSVPTDGAQKSFIIQSRDIQPELVIKTAPALDPTAYLEASFINTEEAPLLAGEVTLIRDNAFVGRGRMAFTAPGDKVSLGFGADDRVKVARVPLRRKETEPSLLGSTKSDIRDFKITVKNLHDFAVKTVIVDQIPFSEAANLTVEPLPTNTAPTEKVVADKRGVMSWTYDLKPREEKEVRIGYRIRYPSDREIVLEPAPNPK